MLFTAGSKNKLDRFSKLKNSH